MRQLDIVLDLLERDEVVRFVFVPDVRHPGKPGTNGRYSGGCRCTACTAAHTEATRINRERINR